MSVYKISAPKEAFDQKIIISGSKSISNRLLIIRELANTTFKIHNISSSEDTRLLEESLLNRSTKEFDLKHAGTSIRFLTAFFAIQKGCQVLTGSDRMKERPIGPLVNSLRELGADIDYTEKEGYPPIKIHEFKEQSKSELYIHADISSQFISALCLIAPCLPLGLRLHLEHDLVSRPYLEMTLSLMEHFGIRSKFESNTISILPQQYTDHEYTVESDWSSASYPLALLALSPYSQLSLSSFFQESLQGDSVVLEILEYFGVTAEWKDGCLIAESKPCSIKEFEYDFIQCPDLFQTICVLAAAKKIKLKARGLKTLSLKESDRIKALGQELKKMGTALKQTEEDVWEIEFVPHLLSEDTIFNTHEDHRMAMSLSLMSTQIPIQIENPEVVIKSYPEFWHDLKSMGFQIQKIPT